MEDEITPALNVKHDVKNELSAEEFQRQLYLWFEDRGLLAELRAHLRMQMIGVLKDTPIGRSSNTKLRQTASPKLQALNLLIAEFLLHQEYHYSLCVFSTEVPLINVFPEFSNCIIDNTAHKHNSNPCKWRFSEQDMWDLLETLGILQNTEEGETLASAYYNNNEDALLTCIIRFLCSIKKPNINLTETNKLKLNSYDGKTLKSISDLLSAANIQTHFITQIVNHIKQFLSEEKRQLDESQREQNVRLRAALEEETAKKVLTYKRRMKEIEKSFDMEKKILENELLQTKTNLQRSSTMLQNRFEELEQERNSLQAKRNDIQLKEDELKNTQKKLQSELEELYLEKMHVNELKKELEHKVNFKKTEYPDENACCSRDINLKQPEKSYIDQTQQTVNNIEIENTLLKQTIRQMQIDNADLKNQTRDHRNKIYHLAQNTRLVMGELHNYGSRTINVISRPIFSRTSTTPSMVPSMPLLSTRPRNIGNISNVGSGEEASAPDSPRFFNSQSPRENREIRKRNLPRRYSNNTSSSEDPSPTEEVLEEARQRLRNLEVESEEIDRNFREYRKKHPNISVINDRELHESDNFEGNIFPNRYYAPTNNTDSIFRDAKPSTSYAFCDVPSTSAEKVFNYRCEMNSEITAPKLFSNKITRNLGHSKLLFQTQKSVKEQNVDEWSNQIKKGMLEKNDLLIEDDEIYEKENRNSEQSANSSGFLNEIVPATSFSTIDVSSNKSDSSQEDKKPN